MNFSAKTQDGITVVELLVVLALMAALLAIAIPSMNMIGSSRVDGAARTVWSDMQHAKMLAVKNNDDVQVDFGSTGYSFPSSNSTVFSRNIASEYKDVELETNEPSVTFFSNTTTDVEPGDNFEIKIKHGTRQKTITIKPLGHIGDVQ